MAFLLRFEKTWRFYCDSQYFSVVSRKPQGVSPEMDEFCIQNLMKCAFKSMDFVSPGAGHLFGPCSGTCGATSSKCVSAACIYMPAIDRPKTAACCVSDQTARRVESQNQHFPTENQQKVILFQQEIITPAFTVGCVTGRSTPMSKLSLLSGSRPGCCVAPICIKMAPNQPQNRRKTAVNRNRTGCSPRLYCSSRSCSSRASADRLK